MYLFWGIVVGRFTCRRKRGDHRKKKFFINNLLEALIAVKTNLVSVKTNHCIKDESVLVEMFNNQYTNIVEKTSGIATEGLGDSFLPENDEETVNKILKHYENHPSVSKIKYI